MIIHRRCTVCHEDIDSEEVEQCSNCGLAIHAKCAAFVQTFDCPECAEELAIGVVEF